MAFEKINEYTNALKAEYIKRETKGDWDRSFAVLDCMVLFYQTVLQTAKFKGQREYMKKVITEINPPFAKGFFKTK